MLWFSAKVISKFYPHTRELDDEWATIADANWRLHSYSHHHTPQ